MQQAFPDDLRFRVLTVGNTGVGKTSLIKAIFKIDTIEASSMERGICDINEELHSDENKHFVLHDSQGFEPGETVNFNKVKTFLDERSKEADIRKQLHAVWLCIRIPEAGGRLIEAATEELLRLDFGNIPIVIVFTKYDKLYNFRRFKLSKKPAFLKLNEDGRRAEIKKETDEYFQTECVQKLKLLGEGYERLKWIYVSTEPRYSAQHAELVQITEDLVGNHVRLWVWLAAARAQRVNVDLNIEASIEVGKTRYWDGLASGTNLFGRQLLDCFSVIHRDIIGIWNLPNDANDVLQSNTFKSEIFALVQDLADSQTESSVESGFSANLDTIKKALDAATPLGAPMASLISIFGLSVSILRLFSKAYGSAPDTVRSLMGYVIDLTMTLETLFWIKFSPTNQIQVTDDDTDAAFNSYGHSKERVDIHREIRKFVDQMNLVDRMRPDKTHDEVKRIIEAYRRDFIDEKNSKFQ